ncbi:synaptonemal complex protein 2 isoform X7 [Hydra vulgaris]|uniref:Synaptonemal complex protein 2 isoform X7 n=1 Tax=Hydra vulgaris TaxID=6087 RepID=A0ABM4BTR5_HYDVU
MKNKTSEITETDPRPLWNVFNDLWKVLNQDLNTISSETIKSCAKNIMNVSSAENGMQALLDFKDKAILLKIIEIFFHLKKTMNMEVIEDIIEIIHVIMETEEDFSINANLIFSLMDIVVQQSKFCFNAQIEAAKLLNLLLEKYPDIHSRHSPSKELFIKSFGICLKDAGDYELQASIIEAIYRMVSIDDRKNIAKFWFNEQQLQNAAVAIRNEEFEMDCRRFLNFFNTFDASNQRVFSFPVQCVSLGRYRLSKPIDFQISEFWLDINIGSKSISTYVQDDSMDTNSDWEMVVIKKEIIKDFRVNVNEEKIIMVIKLNVPAYTLAPFCPESSEHYVKIIFTKHDKVLTAIQQLLGEIKFVNAPAATSPNNLSALWCRSSAAISPLNVQVRTISNKKVLEDVSSTIQNSKNDSKQKLQSPAINYEIQSNCEESNRLKSNNLNKSSDKITDNRVKINEHTDRTSKEKDKAESSKVISENKKINVAKSYKNKTEENSKETKVNNEIYENTTENEVNTKMVENTKNTKDNKNIIDNTKEIKDKMMESTIIKDKMMESTIKMEKIIQVVSKKAESKNLIKDVEAVNKNQIERMTQNNVQKAHEIMENNQVKTDKNINDANTTGREIITESNNSEIKKKIKSKSSEITNISMQNALSLVSETNNADCSKPKFASVSDLDGIKQESRKNQSDNQSDKIDNKSKGKHDVTECIYNHPHVNQNGQQQKNQMRKNVQEKQDADFNISKSLNETKTDCSKLKKLKKLLQTKQVLFQDSPDESYVAPPVCKPQLKSIDMQIEKKKISSEKFKNISSKSLEVFDFPDMVAPSESDMKLNKIKYKENSLSKKKVNNYANDIDGDKNDVSAKSAVKLKYEKNNKIDSENVQEENKSKENVRKENKTEKSKEDKVVESERKSNKYPKRACKSKIIQYRDSQSEGNTTSDEVNKIETNDAENDKVGKKRKRNLSDDESAIQSLNKDLTQKSSNKKSIKNSFYKEPVKISLNKESVKQSTRQFLNEEPIKSSLNYTKDCFKKIKNEQLHTSLFDFEDSDPNECPSQEPWWIKKNKYPRVKKQYRLKHKAEVQLSTSSSSTSDSTSNIIENSHVKNQYRFKCKTELSSPLSGMSESTPENACVKKRKIKRKAELQVSSSCTQGVTPEIVNKKAKTYKNISISKAQDKKSKLKTKKTELKTNPKNNKNMKKVKIQCPKVTNMCEISDFSESQDSIKILRDFDNFSPVKDSLEPKESAIQNIPKPIIPDNSKNTFFDKKEIFLPENQCLVSSERNSDKSPLPNSESKFTDETPIGVPVESKKKWLKDLNIVFNKIEAVANQYPPKKKLWKSPVVATTTSFVSVNEELNKNEEQKKQYKQKSKFIKQKSSDKNVELSSLHVTPLTFDSNEESEIESQDTVNNFAVFCKSILEKSNSKIQSANEQNQSLLVLNKIEEKKAEEYAKNCSSYKTSSTFQEKGKNVFKKNINAFYVSPSDISSDCISPPDVYTPDSKRPFMLCKSVGYNDSNITSRDLMKENNISVDKFICKVAKVTERRLQLYLAECMENRSLSLNNFSELYSKELHDWHFTSQLKDEQLKKTLKQLESIMNEHMHNEKKHIKHLSQFHNKYIEEQRNIIKVNEHKKSNMLTQLREEICSIKLQMSNSVRETQITSFRRSLETMLNNV